MKQDLVGVDVADPRHRLLIHQRRFDIAFSACEGSLERRKIETWIEGVRAKTLGRDKRVGVGRQPDAPKQPDVGVSQMMTVGKIETHSVVRRILLAVRKMFECAGHPEMQCQPARWSEVDQEVFAVPPGRADPGTFEAARQLAGREVRQDPRIGDRHVADGPAQAGRIQMPLIQFDIR